MSATKRWIFQLPSLSNHNRPIQPGVTITRRGGNGILPTPPRKRGKK